MSNDRKHLIIAAEIYPPDIGGPATYAHMLVASLKLKSYQAAVVTFGDEGKRENEAEEGMGLVVVDRNRSVLIRLLVYFFTLWRLSRYSDVIYAMGPVASGLPAVIIVRMRRYLRSLQSIFVQPRSSDSDALPSKKSLGLALGETGLPRIIVRVAGDRAWETAQVRGGTELFEAFQAHRHRGWVGVMEKIERFVVKRADRVVVPSKFLKRVVVEWGAEEGKVRVIPNAVDARRPHLQTRSLAPAVSLTQSFGAARPSDTMPAAPRNGLGSGRLAQGRSKRIHLITIGRLVPWKGFDDAIRALRYVHKNIHDCELIVIGDGPERARLMALAAEESLESFVRFVGVIPHEHLDEYWSQAAVFVLPSGYEGFAHLVIEAWAAGVPVIASSIPANMEIIRDGATGLLAPYRYPLALADAVVRLLQDAVLRESLVMQGKKEFEKYQWTAIFDETMKVLFNK